MKKISLFAVVAALFFTSCQEEENTKPALNIPATYDGNNYETNAQEELNYRNALNALVNEAKKGRTNGTTLTYNSLIDLYGAGTPSVQSFTTAYYNALLTGADGFLNQMALSSGGTYTPGTPTGNGGTYGGYLFDENGVEMEQLLEKGLFGAASYNRAVQLLNAPNTTTPDRVMALFGAHPSFPNTPTASKTANPDVHMANYAARRSDSTNSNSLYRKMEKSFILFQAAVKAGDDYIPERDQAMADIKLNWEKINAATAINYFHSVISNMSNTSPTDAQKASSLHALGEAIGFLWGWKNVSDKKISNAQIDELLGLMLVTPGTPACYRFVTEPAATLGNLEQAIAKLQSIYGFSSAEINDFKNNYVSLQGR